MAPRGKNSLLFGEILDGLERATREVGKSIDPLRDSVDHARLREARARLASVLDAVDALLAQAQG